MKTRNKMQKEGQKRLTGLQGQKPCKKLGGKWQKIVGGALVKSEREVSLKNFLKKCLWKRHSDLLRNMFYEFRSIETDRDSL